VLCLALKKMKGSKAADVTWAFPTLLLEHRCSTSKSSSIDFKHAVEAEIVVSSVWYKMVDL